jgi:hypothetical protein
MKRTTLSIVLVGLLGSASGCADQWIGGIVAGLIATQDPVVEVLGGDNDAFFYTVDREARGSKDLYRYDLATNQRQLLRSLPNHLFSLTATDGRYVVFTQGESTPVQGIDFPRADSVVVSDLDTADEWVLFEGAGGPLEERGAYDNVYQVAVEGGRVAYMTSHAVPGEVVDRLVVEDLTGREPVRRSESVLMHELHLRGDYLAYTASNHSPTRIILHDFTTDKAITVAEDVSTAIDSVYIELAQDAVVWAVEDWEGPSETAISEVYVYDIRTGETQLWAEQVPGNLRGATREYFLTVEGTLGFLFGTPGPITIRRHDREGHAVKLDEFPFTAGTGGAHVIGDWAVWTNETWQIVLEPLAGGDRRVIDPF